MAKTKNTTQKKANNRKAQNSAQKTPRSSKPSPTELYEFSYAKGLGDFDLTLKHAGSDTSFTRFKFGDHKLFDALYRAGRLRNVAQREGIPGSYWDTKNPTPPYAILANFSWDVLQCGFQFGFYVANYRARTAILANEDHITTHELLELLTAEQKRSVTKKIPRDHEG